MPVFILIPGLIGAMFLAASSHTRHGSNSTKRPVSMPAIAAQHAAGTAGIVDVNGTGWTPTGLQGAIPAVGACHYKTAADGYTLPDPTCTPGAINALVTQNNLDTTICRPGGYTSSVRPPVGITEPAKYKMMAAYSARGSASLYEFDHFVPLGLGGASTISNLWPEPEQGNPAQFDPSDPYGANAKDGVEDALHSAVCDGKVTLRAAQNAIVTNWTTALSSLGLAY